MVEKSTVSSSSDELSASSEIELEAVLLVVSFFSSFTVEHPANAIQIARDALIHASFFHFRTPFTSGNSLSFSIHRQKKNSRPYVSIKSQALNYFLNPIFLTTFLTKLDVMQFVFSKFSPVKNVARTTAVSTAYIPTRKRRSFTRASASSALA